MNTLAARLLLSFTAVILLVGLVTIVVSERAASTGIRDVMMVDQSGRMSVTDAAGLRDRLEQLYAASGSWQEGRELLNETAQHQQMMGGAIVLAGPDGEIIGGAPGGRLSTERRAEALPLVVNGQVVGLLWVSGFSQISAQTTGEILSRVRTAVLTAVALAGFLAFILGLVIARNLGRPLDRVAEASAALAEGKSSVRVPVEGPAEVQTVARAFNRMAESLAEQEALRRLMLADIAHELRTPLAVLQAQVEALADGVFAPTAENLEPLSVQTAHLTHMVEDLRTLANADAGQLELHRAPVALAAIVAELIASTSAEAVSRGVSVTADLAPGIPALDADPVRLRQVLANLLSNALHHTPSGGSVVLGAARVGPATCAIKVADTGGGIAEDDLPYVFERFYRGDRSRSRSTGGSGLGLAIAKRLTEAHGGTIRLDSTLGRGTTVTLEWPLAMT